METLTIEKKENASDELSCASATTAMPAESSQDLEKVHSVDDPAENKVKAEIYNYTEKSSPTTKKKDQEMLENKNKDDRSYCLADQEQSKHPQGHVPCSTDKRSVVSDSLDQRVKEEVTMSNQDSNNFRDEVIDDLNNQGKNDLFDDDMVLEFDKEGDNKKKLSELDEVITSNQDSNNFRDEVIDDLNNQDKDDLFDDDMVLEFDKEKDNKKKSAELEGAKETSLGSEEKTSENESTTCFSLDLDENDKFALTVETLKMKYKDLRYVF